MMGEIQILPPGSPATATVTTSVSSIAPNQNVTLTAKVVDASTGNPAPAGLVQFELNGANVGNPATIANGVATLNAAVDGNVGTNNLTAFYEGDNTYIEVTSPSIPITLSPFGLASSGATAAAIATGNVNIANNYTNLINLTCTLPSNLTEGARFAEPKLRHRHRPGATHCEYNRGTSGEQQAGQPARMAGNWRRRQSPMPRFIDSAPRRWSYPATGTAAACRCLHRYRMQRGSGRTDLGTCKREPTR